jgi:type II secretory ATPase GspE/PulE/Tfp pilus assembly ATPase PilB-like protein
MHAPKPRVSHVQGERGGAGVILVSLPPEITTASALRPCPCVGCDARGQQWRCGLHGVLVLRKEPRRRADAAAHVEEVGHAQGGAGGIDGGSPTFPFFGEEEKKSRK